MSTNSGINESVEFHQNNCTECTEPDNVNMVQCDECDSWAHFGCVGVGAEIEHSDWSCKLCTTTISGLSISDTEPVRASVVGAPPTKQVNNVKTIDRAVGSINVSHAPQVDTSVRSKPVVSKVGKKSTVVIASDAKELIGTETETNVASSSIGSKTGALVQESNLEVGIKAIRSKSPCLKGVKTENDLPVLHNELDDQKAFEFYKTKLAKLGGHDMRETVREIGQALIADSVLMNYSYLGRRKKLRFKDYDNLTKLVVASTIQSMKRRYFEVHGKAWAQSDDEIAKLYADVERYFTAEYIKKAEIRFNNSMK